MLAKICVFPLLVGLTVAPAPALADLGTARENACMSCHSLDRKVVGPAFRDVARKYAGDSAAAGTLVATVKKGGKGKWGTAPMPPNPQVSDADLKKIVAWVLAL
jgi:cytochrome c